MKLSITVTLSGYYLTSEFHDEHVLLDVSNHTDHTIPIIKLGVVAAFWWGYLRSVPIYLLFYVGRDKLHQVRLLFILSHTVSYSL